MRPKTRRRLRLGKIGTVTRSSICWLSLTIGGVPIVFGEVVKTSPPTTTTAVSGFQSSTETETYSDDFVGLKGFTLQETSDNPCKLWLHAGSLPLSTSDPSDKILTFRCPSGVLPTISSETAEFSGERLFVRGVKVCTNNKPNHRVKGIKIYSAKVLDDGTVIKGNPEQSFERANCASWKQLVTCPSDAIAVGATAHYTHDGLTGLALRCREVRAGFARPSR